MIGLLSGMPTLPQGADMLIWLNQSRTWVVMYMSSLRCTHLVNVSAIITPMLMNVWSWCWCHLQEFYVCLLGLDMNRVHLIIVAVHFVFVCEGDSLSCSKSLSWETLELPDQTFLQVQSLVSWRALLPFYGFRCQTWRTWNYRWPDPVVDFHSYRDTLLIASVWSCQSDVGPKVHLMEIGSVKETVYTGYGGAMSLEPSILGFLEHPLQACKWAFYSGWFPCCTDV